MTGVTADESPRKDTTARSTRQAQTFIPEGWHRHCRERAGTERRCQCAGRHLTRFRQGSRSSADGAHHPVRDRWRRPKDLFFAPIVAVKNLLAKSGTRISDYDLIEANEAFAVQAIADGRALGWDWDRVNVNGGAVALGHPIGASGARVLTTLLYAMKDRDKTTGLATLCLGGGMRWHSAWSGSK